MRINLILFVAVWFLAANVAMQGQSEDWRRLVALESTREDVERILGKPDKYFETYGNYKTRAGKFSVWYARGGCQQNAEGLQYDVPAQRMTGLYVFVSGHQPVEYYTSGKPSYEKTKFQISDGRFNYTSQDQTEVIQTIQQKDMTEFVYTISIQPGKDKEELICKPQRTSTRPPAANSAYSKTTKTAAMPTTPAMAAP